MLDIVKGKIGEATMSNPLGFAQTAVSVVLGRDHLVGRDINQMTIPELEARAKVNAERLRLARQAGWLGGFGGGLIGALSVAKMMR
jgi:hypothetical protein